jgi:hypothetical protein
MENQIFLSISVFNCHFPTSKGGLSCTHPIA